MSTQTANALSSLPPQLLLYQMGTGHYLSRALGLAARIGMADCIKRGARSYQEAEFRSLYERAGFKLTKIIPAPARAAIIEGELA